MTINRASSPEKAQPSFGAAILPVSNARLEALTEADFEAVANLGREIWRLHYSTIISMAQIDFMLDGRYSPENLRKYLASGDRWFEILRLGEKPVGYCSYSLTANSGEMKLEQLYLLEGCRGERLGWVHARSCRGQGAKKGYAVVDAPGKQTQ